MRLKLAFIAVLSADYNHDEVCATETQGASPERVALPAHYLWGFTKYFSPVACFA